MAEHDISIEHSGNKATCWSQPGNAGHARELDLGLVKAIF